MSTLKKSNDRLMVPLIGSLSIVVPALVAILIFFDLGHPQSLGDVSFLPAVNAVINSTVSVLLVAALFAIKRKQVPLHRFMMTVAFVLSAFFLVSYVIYHYAHGDVKFGGTGGIKVLYLVILFTHILASVAVVPLALFALYRGYAGQVERHRKIVRYAWPIWFYVSVTGVMVYWFAHVYNPGL